jgi:hypothetical protein
MTEYIVGLRQGKRSEVLTIEAEDALIAALKVKHNHPEALISYVRKSNRRGIVAILIGRNEDSYAADDTRLWPLADIPFAPPNVCFWG